MFIAKPITHEVDANGCWNCTSHSTDTCGYPSICRNGKKMHTSRFIWIEKNGPIPDGMVIRHKCDNPLCINPDHLEIGTQADNIHDMVERGRRKPTFGADNPRANLQENDVLNIIALFKSGWHYTDIAQQYRVKISSITNIIYGKTWKKFQKYRSVGISKEMIHELTKDWKKGIGGKKGVNKGKLAGEKNPKAKISINDVIDIRNRFANGEKQSYIAKIYKLRPDHIYSIVRRKSWNHINEGCKI